MDGLRRLDIDYSLKNIPVPSAKVYRKALIKKMESVVKRMRWKAWFFLKDDQADEADLDNTRVFKSRKCPPAS